MRDDQKSQSFYARWSQRKMQRQSEADTTQAFPVSQPVEPQHDPAATDFPAQGQQPLPDIDSLDEHSDYSAFLSPEVSEDLQRMALRKLFASDRFNVRDGLDDYDEDYSSFHSLGDTVTAEMRHRLERERLSDKEEMASPERAVVQQDQAEQVEAEPEMQSQNEPGEEPGTT